MESPSEESDDNSNTYFVKLLCMGILIHFTIIKFQGKRSTGKT